MKAADFVLDTISHFVRQPDGPPPGVPARVGPSFETNLSGLCADQGVSAIISRSLERLALPPAISNVTAVRLRRDGEQTTASAERRLMRLAQLLDALDTTGARSLLMGDALSAVTLYPDGRGTRAVEMPELLVDETRAGDTLRAAAAEGFTQRRTDPSLDPTPAAPPTLRAARDLVEFHHYMSPLVLWNDDGDRVRVRFRSLDLTPPLGREWAWERSRVVTLAGREAEAVSPQDHIVDLALRLGCSRYADLGAVIDLGLVLSHPDVQWERVRVLARASQTYAAVHHALTHVSRVLALGIDIPLEPPPAVFTKLLDLIRPSENVDYSRAPFERNKFVYGLLVGGGPVSKLRWLWRHAVPRRDWVERVAGNASNPWSWLTFQLIVRESAHGRGRDIGRFNPGDNVTRIDRDEE